MRVKISALISVALVSIFGLAPLGAYAQGSLAPPGPPGASMLTLSQVQPRIPVDSVHTPGNSSTEFLITAPGSYYLTTNIIGVSTEYGIEITASDVTLDLNGFSMIAPATANSGIIVFSGITNTVIRNGIINGWSSLNDAIFSEANNITIENMSVSGAGTGVGCLGFGGVIRNCTVSLSGEDGIYVAGPGYLVYGNTCVGNNTVNEANGAAIFINASNNRIENNFVIGSGPAGFGIIINTGAANTNNVFVRNTVQGNGANDYLVDFHQLTGPVITNVISGIITNSNPWANFGF
jgi:Right handed beta helix region